MEGPRVVGRQQQPCHVAHRGWQGDTESGRAVPDPAGSAVKIVLFLEGTPMKRFVVTTVFLAICWCGLPTLAQQQPPTPFVPVTDAMLRNPDPGDWLMWRRTLNSWGYSPLNQIT